tara:strand:- start:23 stop:685 length:663 start_codon:yes stop_codon:yes gene_type:complete
MKNKFITALASLMLMLSFTSLKAADMNIGLSVMVGQLDTTGSETEKVDLANTPDVNSKSFKEKFYGASVFLEAVADNGLTLGIDYVPVDLDIGDGKRTDSAVATAAGGAENDTGNRSASASLEDLITIYTNVPLGGNGYYALLGYHKVDVSTSETLPNSAYGNIDLNGYQIGLGKKGDNFKVEAFYSDFEDISLTSTGGSGAHVIDADADAMGLKLAFFY